MTLDEKARLSCYQTISVLNEEHGVFVAQHTENRQIFVKKILSVYNRKVYEYLKVNHIPGIPYIYEVFEDDGKLIVIEDPIWGPAIRVSIENKGTRNLTVQTRDVSINGFMVDPMFSSDVNAGKHAIDDITFMESDLEKNDITEIESVELSFHFFDWETWDNDVDTEVVSITF